MEDHVIDMWPCHVHGAGNGKSVNQQPSTVTVNVGALSSALAVAIQQASTPVW